MLLGSFSSVSYVHPPLLNEILLGVRPPQGLWGTRELAIFINGNTGTSGNFQGTTFKKGLLLRNWGTFQHFFLGNIQQILLGTREIF